MNKNTQIIDFQKMYKLKTPASRYSELSVSISEKGMLTIVHLFLTRWKI